MKNTQNYENHTRWYPLAHFVITPILTFNLIWQAVSVYRERTWDSGVELLVAVTLILISTAARLQALKAQDRVIRLEESLRYQRVLSGESADRAQTLSRSQIIALRFAPDEELAGLIERIASDDLITSKEIKRAIKNWRPDHHRV